MANLDTLFFFKLYKNILDKVCFIKEKLLGVTNNLWKWEITFTSAKKKGLKIWST